MKRYSILNFVGALSMLLFVACEPIEDRLSYENSFHPDQIELEVIQETPGSNGLTLKMKTPGVTGYWDYGIDTKFSDEVVVNYPLPGQHTFTFHVTTPYLNSNGEAEYISKTISATISNLDKPLPTQYGLLVGSDFNRGKTWVYDFDNSPGWWYMTGDAWTAFWWQPDTSSDMNGKMVFDLNGAANITTYAVQAGPEKAKGSWSFNGDYSKITIGGAGEILSVEDGGVCNSGSKVYDVIELTENKLVLFQSDMAWSPGWVWVLKAAN